MNDSLYALLWTLCEGKKPDQFVFTREDGSPVKDFRDAWHNLCVRAGAPGSDGIPSRFHCSKCGAPIDAGVKNCRAIMRDEHGNEHGCEGVRKYVGLLMHDMRRSAARNLRSKGVHENVIMAIGGWKTRSMFDRYAIVNNDDKRRAIEALADPPKQLGPRTAFETNHSADEGEDDGKAVVQ